MAMGTHLLMHAFPLLLRGVLMMIFGSAPRKTSFTSQTMWRSY